MKRIFLLLLCLMICISIPITVFAGDNEGNSASPVAITVVVPQKSESVQPTPTPAEKPLVPYLYPVSIWETQNDGQREIVKTYELDKGETPEDISREAFERDGWRYELTDITKKDTASFDSQERSETVEIDTGTKDMDAIINLLAPEMEYQSEDGYIGILFLDISSITVETAGTKKNSYTVSATREYLNLSSNDTSLIPKTITDNGRTLTLCDVKWNAQTAETVDYEQLPASYTAVVTYTTTAFKTTVTGYVTTAEYRGTVSKIITGKTVYTAYFIGIPIVIPMLNEAEKPSTEQEPTPEAEIVKTTETESPSEMESEVTAEPIVETELEQKMYDFLLILIIVIVAAGMGGGFVFIYFKKKRKGNVSNEEIV